MPTRRQICRRWPLLPRPRGAGSRERGWWWRRQALPELTWSEAASCVFFWKQHGCAVYLLDKEGAGRRWRCTRTASFAPLLVWEFYGAALGESWKDGAQGDTLQAKNKKPQRHTYRISGRPPPRLSKVQFRPPTSRCWSPDKRWCTYEGLAHFRNRDGYPRYGVVPMIEAIGFFLPTVVCVFYHKIRTSTVCSFMAYCIPERDNVFFARKVLLCESKNHLASVFVQKFGLGLIHVNHPLTRPHHWNENNAGPDPASFDRQSLASVAEDLYSHHLEMPRFDVR